MASKIPPSSLAELVRTQLPELGSPAPALPGMRTGGAPAQDPAVPLAWANLPPAILRILSEVAGPQRTPASEPRSNPYVAQEGRTASQSRAITQLLAAADRGTVTVDELNAFLAAAMIDASVVRRALVEMKRDPDLDAIRLGDAVYRLSGGRLVAAHPENLLEAPRLCAKTVAVAFLLLLVAAALLRFS